MTQNKKPTFATLKHDLFSVVRHEALPLFIGLILSSLPWLELVAVIPHINYFNSPFNGILDAKTDVTILITLALLLSSAFISAALREIVDKFRVHNITIGLLLISLMLGIIIGTIKTVTSDALKPVPHSESLLFTYLLNAWYITALYVYKTIWDGIRDCLRPAAKQILFFKS